MINFLELFRIAYELFPPFIGLMSWKYRIASSALYHSISVGALAGSIAELLTDDYDEIDISTYSGLLHDYLQKSSSVGLNAEESREIIKLVLERNGIDKNVIKKVMEATNYNVAENPKIWASMHPVASLSIWLADTIAGTESAFAIHSNVEERIYRLDDVQRRFLESLAIEVVSITIPQVALRSAMYSLIVNKLRKEFDKVVPVVSRDGLIVITRKTSSSKTIDIDINDLRADANELNTIRAASKVSQKTFIERFKPDRFRKNSTEKIYLHESVKSLFINLNVNSVVYSRDSRYSCVFCGLPTNDPVHPASIGYILYGSSSMERWNPRVPAVGVNLNRLMQSSWLKVGIVACPLCVLDALVTWRDMNNNKIESADYFIQLHFPLPTHYDIARYLSSILNSIVIASINVNPYITLDLLIELLTSSQKYAEFVEKNLKESLPEKTGRSILIDSTWATHIEVVRSRDGEAGSFAYYLPYLAKAVLLTGVYPVKFGRKTDPIVERRLICPVYPLYDYDLTDVNLVHQTPLVVTLLSILDRVEDELAQHRGERLTIEDRVNLVLKYIKYPNTVLKDLLIKHRVGRILVEHYHKFKEKPIEFFK